MARARKKTIRKRKSEPSAIIFIFVTAAAFGLMIAYVWLNNGVTEIGNEISFTKNSIQQAKATNRLLRAEVTSLSRADRITTIAEDDLQLIFPLPQPLTLASRINERAPSSEGGSR